MVTRFALFKNDKLEMVLSLNRSTATIGLQFGQVFVTYSGWALRKQYFLFPWQMEINVGPALVLQRRIFQETVYAERLWRRDCRPKKL